MALLLDCVMEDPPSVVAAALEAISQIPGRGVFSRILPWLRVQTPYTRWAHHQIVRNAFEPGAGELRAFLEEQIGDQPGVAVLREQLVDKHLTAPDEILFGRLPIKTPPDQFERTWGRMLLEWEILSHERRDERVQRILLDGIPQAFAMRWDAEDPFWELLELVRISAERDRWMSVSSTLGRVKERILEGLHSQYSDKKLGDLLRKGGPLDDGRRIYIRLRELLLSIHHLGGNLTAEERQILTALGWIGEAASQLRLRGVRIALTR